MRGPRGGFQGTIGSRGKDNQGSNLTRIGRGEFSQMMRTLNFDHHMSG